MPKTVVVSPVPRMVPGGDRYVRDWRDALPMLEPGDEVVARRLEDLGDNAPSLLDAIRRLEETGATFRDHEHGLTREAIERVLRFNYENRVRAPRYNPGRPVKAGPEHVERCQLLWDSGMSLEAVAAASGVSRRSFFRRIRPFLVTPEAE